MPPKGIGSLTNRDATNSSDGMVSPIQSGGMAVGVSFATADNEPLQASSPVNDGPASPKTPSHVDEPIVDICPHIQIMLRRHISAAVSVAAAAQAAAASSEAASSSPSSSSLVKNSSRDYFFVKKRIATDTDRAKREYLHCEARVRHPHLLRYLFCSRNSQGVVDVEIELAELGPLDHTFIRLSCEERVLAAKACTRQILSGLVFYYYVHGRVHRDVKPQNFLLCRHGTVKIADFDVSRTLSQQDHMCDFTIRGTQGYMSPELIENAIEIDPLKCDAWSLGVTLMQAVECNTDSDKNRKSAGDCGGPPKAQLPFDKFKMEPKQGPSQKHVEQLRWEVLSDASLKYLVQRCLVVNPKDRASLLELLTITHVVKPKLTAKGVDDVAEAAAAAAVAAACGTSKAVANAASTAAVETKKAGQQQQDWAQTMWADSFLDPERDAIAAAAVEHGIVLADAVLRGHVTTADDPNVTAKVQEAAGAVLKEFASWKSAREKPGPNGKFSDDHAKVVDRVMKDVIIARNKKCVDYMATLIKKYNLPSLVEGLVDNEGRPNVPLLTRKK